MNPDLRVHMRILFQLSAWNFKLGVQDEERKVKQW
jgi:hypothetical protein